MMFGIRCIDTVRRVKIGATSEQNLFVSSSSEPRKANASKSATYSFLRLVVAQIERKMSRRCTVAVFESKTVIERTSTRT